MGTLTIHRVNSKKFLVKDGDKVLRRCFNFKEALNTLISENTIFLEDDSDEYLEDDSDYSYSLDKAA